MAHRKGSKAIAFGAKASGFDEEIYGSGDMDMVRELPTDAEEAEMSRRHAAPAAAAGSHPPTIEEIRRQAMLEGPEEDDPMARYRESHGSGLVNTRIADREREYQKRGRERTLSPEREDVFSGKKPTRSYKDIMTASRLQQEEARVKRIIEKKKERERDEERAAISRGETMPPPPPPPPSQSSRARKRRRRWDNPGDNKTSGEWEATKPVTKSSGRFGEVGGEKEAAAPQRRSRWDDAAEEVASSESVVAKTPAHGAVFAPTPARKSTFGSSSVTDATRNNRGNSSDLIYSRKQAEMSARNLPMTDEQLDALLPQEGYEIVNPPDSYIPVKTSKDRLLAEPTPLPEETRGFVVAATPAHSSYGIEETITSGDLPHIKPEDYQYFSALLEKKTNENLTPAQMKERTIMELLLNIKNGMPPQRKRAMRKITDSARELGAGPLFGQILPLLMSRTLEDQERHLLVKVIDRIMYKLDELVRPYAHKILVVITPLLLDEDYHARLEGRQVIANLAKAAGLATMISVMRPDIDDLDDYVRNTTARAFSIVASALGVPALLPFLKAVCMSRTTWQARHTGIKIVQHIAIIMGCGMLPHLNHLVSCIAHGLLDRQRKVKTMTALALASLAEAAHPYGIESFELVLRPLWQGISQNSGKSLAAFLKAIGFIISLMDEVHANQYTKEVMPILVREFKSPDEDQKKVVLKVVQQCVSADGVDPEYIIKELLPEFFRNFWVRRTALDQRNKKALIETTVEVANKVGLAPILMPIVSGLKDESEAFRYMVMKVIDLIVKNLGTSDLDARLEEELMDGVIYAFQEQGNEENEGRSAEGEKIMLSGFGTIVNALGKRTAPYLPQICGTIKWRLRNDQPAVRMQAADLVAGIADVIMTCDRQDLLAFLGVLLYEFLGEEYPDVLGSILGALTSIVNVIGMTNMQPPIKDLLPRLTPILKNRHEKVQQNVIQLVGRIADRGAEHVAPKEWMRICFDLLEMLKASRKVIRRATVSTFGYIAKAIGPQDVLHTLLNNLKVQERTNRVCTTVAIGIVAETCAPFTVLPALMNEYRVPEVNVQNGVLKSLAFMFEYISDTKDYIFAVTPLLEDALVDRDLVHRQIACNIVKHLALGVAGQGCEEALIHLLNFVWPNIFETSPHVISAVFDAIEAVRVAIGVPRIMLYLLHGLFHPARRVREVYWKLYNNTYCYAQDACTAAYPRIPDYRRTHLELLI